LALRLFFACGVPVFAGPLDGYRSQAYFGPKQGALKEGPLFLHLAFIQ